MSFADPLVITINGVAKSLVRVDDSKYSSEYMLREATGELRLAIRNSTYVDKKRGVNIDRHNVELTQTVFPVAPAITSTVRKTYAVIENQQGDTLSDPAHIAAGMFTMLTSSANANITKLFNFES